MKPNATLEDYQNRDKFIISYLESQIKKAEDANYKYGSEESLAKRSAYKDILYKLTKDESKTNS